MPKVSVIILCDGDGTVQRRTVLDIPGILKDAMVNDLFMGRPVILTGENVDSAIAPIRNVCPAIAAVSHLWLAAELVSRLLKCKENEFAAIMLANADTYQTVLDVEGEIELYVVSPAESNCRFAYRCWESVESNLVYDDNGDEFCVERYRRKGKIDVNEFDMANELDRIECELNSDVDTTLTADEEKELGELVKHIVGGWRLCRAIMGEGGDMSALTYGSGASDDGDDGDESDDAAAIMEDLNEIIKLTGNLSKRISEMYVTMQFTANLLNRTVDSMNNMESRLSDRIAKIEHCDSIRRRMLISLRHETHGFLDGIDEDIEMTKVSSLLQLDAIGNIRNDLSDGLARLTREIQRQKDTLELWNTVLTIIVIILTLVTFGMIIL